MGQAQLGSLTAGSRLVPTLASFFASFLTCSLASIWCLANSSSLISSALNGHSAGIPGSLGSRGFLPVLASFFCSLAFLR